MTRSLPRCLPLSFCLHTFDEIATALPCAAPLLLDHAWLFLAHNCIILTFGAALLHIGSANEPIHVAIGHPADWRAITRNACRHSRWEKSASSHARKISSVLFVLSFLHNK